MDRSDDQENSFADPLLAAVGGDSGREPVPARSRAGRLAGAVVWMMVGIGLGLGAYLFWDTHQEIQRLNQDLTDSESRLDQIEANPGDLRRRDPDVEGRATKRGNRIQTQDKEAEPVPGICSRD